MIWLMDPDLIWLLLVTWMLVEASGKPHPGLVGYAEDF